jgi:hypothetical protein
VLPSLSLVVLSLLESSAAVVASVVVVARFSVAFAPRAASAVVIFVVATCHRRCREVKCRRHR